MKKTILILVGLAVINIAKANELKNAFDAGIKSTLKVMKYEKQNVVKKLENGYCLSLKNENGELDGYSIVKLESLSLLLGRKPSLIASNFSKRKIVCFAMSDSKDEILEIKKEAKQKYKKFDKFFPKIIYIDASKYHREIPTIGKYNKDQTKVIDALSERIVELKMKLKKLNSVSIEELREKLDLAQEENQKLKQTVNKMKNKLRNKLGQLQKELNELANDSDNSPLLTIKSSNINNDEIISGEIDIEKKENRSFMQIHKISDRVLVIKR